MMLNREFYLRDANTVARELLGKKLVHKTADGITARIIVETEAYCGASDKGAHAYGNKRTARTEVLFGPGGHAYVYLIYGMHCCLNFAANTEDVPDCVLIRALEPLDGLPLMAQRRNTEKIADLCSGPGKLCQAMAITRKQYGIDLCGDTLYVEPYREIPNGDILVSPRINIDFAEESKNLLWRYFLRANPFVSKVPKKYREQTQPLPV